MTTKILSERGNGGNGFSGDLKLQSNIIQRLVYAFHQSIDLQLDELIRLGHRADSEKSARGGGGVLTPFLSSRQRISQRQYEPVFLWKPITTCDYP